jgi:hypothetical protein
LGSGPELLTSVDSLITQLLRDAEDLVQLSKTLRTGWGTSLDLASTETNRDVSDGNIFSLSGSVRDHDAPSSGVRVVGGLNRLGESSDLVDLKEESVARLLLNGTLDADWVGDGKIITEGYVSIILVLIRVSIMTYPTTWKSLFLWKYCQASQSSSANGSSMETIGYFSASFL